VLFEYSQPTLTVELVPLDCPIRRSNNTGRNQIIFEECSPAQLLISLTPCAQTTPEAARRWVPGVAVGAVHSRHQAAA
jgi:hypothetical protein